MRPPSNYFKVNDKEDPVRRRDGADLIRPLRARLKMNSEAPTWNGGHRTHLRPSQSARLKELLHGVDRGTSREGDENDAGTSP